MSAGLWKIGREVEKLSSEDIEVFDGGFYLVIEESARRFIPIVLLPGQRLTNAHGGGALGPWNLHSMDCLSPDAFFCRRNLLMHIAMFP